MNSFAGKKLLVLGTTQSSYEVVKTAQEQGAYVIVTDNLTDTFIRRQKCADEIINYSTNSYEDIVSFIKSNKIDGVFTGASEFNVQNMITICQLSNLPCYCTREQWDTLQNKAMLKDVCSRYGVATVPTYKENDIDDKCFPVVIKPADSFSSHGIHICNNLTELTAQKPDSLSYSKGKKVIIEKLMKSPQIIAYYIIQDADCHLMCVGDWYKYNNKDGLATVTSAILYPSIYTKAFLEKMDSNIQDLLGGVGIRNGLASFQMFIDDDGIYLYETCLRINGALEYNIINPINGYNPLEMMINYSIFGNMGDANVIKKKNDYNLRGFKACNLAIMLKPGVIHEIKGLKQLREIDNVVHVCEGKEVGDIVNEKDIGTLDQTFTRIHIVSDNKANVLRTIKAVYNTLHVIDQFGEEMILPIRDDLIEALS